MKHAPLLLIVVLFLLMGCDKEPDIVTPPVPLNKIAIEPEFVPQFEKCLWFDDKSAAYTIGFDDARPTHYQVSGPALTARNMRGTFFINTQYIVDWSGWQMLADKGHEIASHTYSHPKLTELTETQQREELSRAITDIVSHIQGIKEVPSFSYPYGNYNDQVRNLIRSYHYSARGDSGINRHTLRDDELTMVRGAGVYPPFDMGDIERRVERAIANRGWLMVYFHSVSAKGDSDYTTIPLTKYLAHLDYVQRRRDCLWIATMGEVTGYLRLRRDAEVRVETVDSTEIEFSLGGLQGRYSDLAPLTVKMKLPQQWRGHEIVLTREGSKALIAPRRSDDMLYIHIPLGGRVRLAASGSR